MIFWGISQNQWKTKENCQKPMFFLCFHWVWPNGTIFGSKNNNIIHQMKKKTFLPNTWNTLKTSFLKCLRVCNFFFSQRCWCSQHLKKYHFWILCENSEHLTAQLQISTQLSWSSLCAGSRSADLVFLHFWTPKGGTNATSRVCYTI